MYINDDQENWPDLLPSACSVMAAMRATPSINSTLAIDIELIPNKELPKNGLDHLKEISQQFGVTREIAKQNIQEAQLRNKKKRKNNRKKYKTANNQENVEISMELVVTRSACRRIQPTMDKTLLEVLEPFYGTEQDYFADVWLSRFERYALLKD